MFALRGDYRQWLNEIYRDRKSSNPKYSIRAFARDLGISTTSLSEVLSFRRHLSRKGVESIAERLGLTDQEKRQLLEAISHKRYGEYDSAVETCFVAMEALNEVISKCKNSTLVSPKTAAELKAIEGEVRRKLRDLLELGDGSSSRKDLAAMRLAHPHHQLEAARVAEERVQAALDSMVHDPQLGGGEHWKLIAATAHLALGHALVLNGELAAQVREFERSLELFEICCQKMDPCPTEVVVDCCRSLYHLGYTHLRSGRIDLSAPYFERVIERAASILDETDRNKKVVCLILAARGLSIYYYELGDFNASLDQATRMAALAKEGRGLDSENKTFNMAEALSAQLQARSCLHLCKYETASQLAAKAVDHLKQLVSKDPTNTHFRRQLAEAQKVLGDVYDQAIAAGGEQRSHCYRAASINAERLADQNEDLHDKFHLALYRALWARAELEQDKSESMVEIMVEIEEQAIAQLEEYVDQRPSNYNWTEQLLVAKSHRLNRTLGVSDGSESRTVANDILAGWLPLMQYPEPPFHWVEGFVEHLTFTDGVRGKPGRPEVVGLLSKIGKQARFSALKSRIDDLVG